MKNWMEKNLGRRLLAMVLCLSMVLSMAPLPAFAEGCTHHPEHTPECGYVAEVTYQPCTHQHDAACGYQEAAPCTHSCADGTCGYREFVPCNHSCGDGNCGFAPAVECDHVHGEQCGENGESCPHTCGDGTCAYSAGAPCNHSHNEVCGYQETQGCGHSHNETCGYREARDCGHQHDESCGYREAVEGSPCTFDCEICNAPQQPATPTCSCETKCSEGNATDSCQVCIANIGDCAGKEQETPETCAHGNDPATCEVCASEARVAAVQAQIDALPEEVTAETKDTVQSFLTAVDAAKAALTETEQAQLDMTRYTALAEKLAALNKCAHDSDPLTCEACASEARVASVQALIDALPAVEELTAETEAQAREQLAIVKAAVEALAAEEQAQLKLDKYTALSEYFEALDEAAKEPTEAEPIVITEWQWDYDEYIHEESGCMVLPITSEEFASYLSDEETYEVILSMLPGAILVGEDELTLGEWTYEAAPEGTAPVEIDGESYYPEGFFKTTLPEGYVLADESTVLSLTLVLIPAENEEDTPVVYQTATNVPYRSYDSSTKTWDDSAVCTSATVVESTAEAVTWNDGCWYVVFGEAIIDQRVTVSGNVHLILANNSNLTINGGISVNEGNSLTIYGQSAGTGSLTATAAGMDAGIRVPEGASLTINGGRITATGSADQEKYGAGAGIGGNGYHFNGENSGAITINGGLVRATGASCEYGGAAGIGGSSCSKSATSITITGGHIIAEGGENGAAGIGGGGHGGQLQFLSITGGYIEATGHKALDDGSGNANAIGGGKNQAAADLTGCNAVVIDHSAKTATFYGKTLNQDMTVPEGYTMTIGEGEELIIQIGVTLTNNGTINIQGTLDNQGTINNNGTISGTVTGNQPPVSVKYLDEKGTEQTCASANVVTGSDTEWSDGWYVVQASETPLTIGSRITVEGDVRLILANNSSFTINGGIRVGAGSSLTIYEQPGEGTKGILTVQNAASGNAGIGGDANSSCGSVTINGGTVNATGGSLGAGIGGGKSGSGGSVTITGGAVNAVGGNYAAGIGGGDSGSGGSVTITGGTVNATGGSDAAGIGDGCEGDNTTFSTGENGHAVIYASSFSYGYDKSTWSGIIFENGNGAVYGDQTLNAAMTVEAGKTLTVLVGAKLTIPDGVTLTNNGTIEVYGTLDGNDNIVGTGRVIWHNTQAGVSVEYKDEKGGTATAKCDVITEDYLKGLAKPYTLTGGWYVVQSDVSIGNENTIQRLTVSGDVRLILANNSSFTINGGIGVSSGNSLTIYEQPGDDTKGILTVQNVDYAHAGIGGTGNESCGTITINGGTVNATGGVNGAGIGGGRFSSCGTVTINGGTVQATGGECGAGIGGGSEGNGGTITINGGTVTANGTATSNGFGGAGIGGGFKGNGGFITINTPVTATGGTGASDIGGGKDGTSGIVFNNSNTATVSQTQTIVVPFGIKEGQTLVVESDCTLTIPAGITVNNNGAILNSGTIANNGTITGTGGVYYPLTLTNCTAEGDVVTYPAETGTLYGKAGGKITLTPDTGLQFLGWSVLDASVTVTDNTFTMPAGPLTVRAEKCVAIMIDNRNKIETSYSNFKSAFEAASDRIDSTLKLTDDVTYSFDLTVPYELILNLNGHKLDLGTHSITVVGSANASLTIQDIKEDSAQKDGSLIAGSLTVGQMAVDGGGEYYKTGMLNIMGGQINARINVLKDSNAYLTGGEFVNPRSNKDLTSLLPQPDGFYSHWYYKTRNGDPETGYTYSNPVPKDELRTSYNNTLYVGPHSHTLQLTNVTNTEHTYTCSVCGGEKTEDHNLDAGFCTVCSVGKASYVNANGVLQNPVLCYRITADYLASCKYTLKPGWYVVTDPDLTIGTASGKQRIAVNGNVNLILADGCSFTVSEGIQVGSGKSLTIWGQFGGDGELVCSSNDHDAGIGGTKNGACGTVIINGGDITSRGGGNSAGIGGSGNNGSGKVDGTIEIHGGTVHANGGENAPGIGSSPRANGDKRILISGGTVYAQGGNNAAGIGGGGSSDGGTVMITGGTVTAFGSNAPGIGGGKQGDYLIPGKIDPAGSGADVTISNAVVITGEIGGILTSGTLKISNSVVLATKIQDTSGKSKGTWSGIVFEGSDGQVYGSVTPTGSFEIPSGKKLLIPTGTSLTIPTGITVTNSGKVYMTGGSVTGSFTNTETGSVYYPLILTGCNAGGDVVTYPAVSGTLYGKAGGTVTLTGIPGIAGEAVSSWMFDEANAGITVTGGNSFTMPSNAVAVTAEFGDILASVTTSGGDTTNFANFQYAFDAANGAADSTLKLLANVSDVPALTVTGKFTLDLNGQTLTSNAETPITVNSGSRLTVIDSTVGSTDNNTVGSITGPNSDSAYNPVIEIIQGGKLDFQSGEIKTIIENYGTLDISGTAKVTVNEGRTAVKSIGDFAKTTISGGALTGLNCVWIINGTVTIKDGTFNAQMNGSNNSYCVYKAGGNVSVEGGTYFKATGDTAYTFNSNIGKTVQGGAFPNGITLESGNTVRSLLKDDKYAFFNLSDYTAEESKRTLVPVDSVQESITEGVVILSHPEHGYITFEQITGENHDFKHIATCSCGYSAELDHVFVEGDVDYNGFCKDCGAYQPATLNGDIYEISNAGQLYWFADYVNKTNKSASAKLMENIDASYTEEGITYHRPWTPIGSPDWPYEGTFDGNGKTVRGLEIKRGSNSDIGFFGTVGIGWIKNLTIADCTVLESSVRKGDTIAVLCGWLGGGTIEGCTNNQVSLGFNNPIYREITLAGICGYRAGGTIWGCTNSGAISGGNDTKVGGICGENSGSGEIKNCTNSGDISGGEKSNVGGICGKNDGGIQFCTNSGVISGFWAGGICGNDGGSVYGCANSGTIEGYEYAGGICGYSSYGPSRCYNIGTVSGEGKHGPICGDVSNVDCPYYCYYLGSQDDRLDGTTAMTEEQFNRGEVTWLLNQDLQEYESITWYQTLTEENRQLYPSLSGGIVYHHEATCPEYDNVETDSDKAHTPKPDSSDRHFCTICGATLVASLRTTAGEEYGYRTIEQAFDAANNERGEDVTLTLHEDVTAKKDLIVYGKFTLNLGNCTLSMGIHENREAICAITIINDGKLTVTCGPGDIRSTIKGEGENLLEVQHGGELVIKGGIIHNRWNSPDSSAVRIYAGGVAEMSGGQLKGQNCVLNEGTLEINGATLISREGVCVSNSGSGTVTISGYSILKSESDFGRVFNTDQGIKVYPTTEFPKGVTFSQGGYLRNILGDRVAYYEKNDWEDRLMYVPDDATSISECCVVRSHNEHSFHYEYVDGPRGTKHNAICGCGYIMKNQDHDFTDNDGFCKLCDAYQPAELVGDTYEISNAGQLFWFADYVNSGNEGAAFACGSLQENITIPTKAGGSKRAWTPIGTNTRSYLGSFSGNGHSISGLYFAGDVDYGSLFGVMGQSGSISSLTVASIEYDESASCNFRAGICGYNDGGEIADCTNAGQIGCNSEFNEPAGICHTNFGTISGCVNTGVVSGWDYANAGGICVVNNGTIKECVNTGYVTGGMVGGICALNGITVNSGAIIQNCANRGDLWGINVAGGICAFNSRTVSDCYHSGSITDGAQDRGPIVGYSDEGSSCSNCYYLADQETDKLDGTTYKTGKRFASGEVAYLLNGGRTEGTTDNPVVWRQKIGMPYPVFSDESDEIVYHHESSCPEYDNNPGDSVLSHTPSLDDETVCEECGAALVASVTIGATISGYRTIDQAFAAANEATWEDVTLKLLGNVKAASDLLVSGSFTLNLNGKTLELHNHMITIRADGSLTVQGEENGSAITGDGFSNLGVQESGTLTIKSGEIIGTQCSVSVGGTATIEGGSLKAPVLNNMGGNLTISDSAKVTADGDKPAVENFGTLTIKGGSLKGRTCVMHNAGTTTIEDGIFTPESHDGSSYCVAYNAAGGNDSSLTITGGNFYSWFVDGPGEKHTFFIGDQASTDEIHVTGGIFYGGVSVKANGSVKPKDVLESGYAFYENIDDGAVLNGYETITENAKVGVHGQHTFSYSKKDDSQHTATCACGYSEDQDHIVFDNTHTVCVCGRAAYWDVTASEAEKTKYADCQIITADYLKNVNYTLSDGWYVVQGEVTIGSRITVEGNVHLILADGCKFTVNGGIGVSAGNSLTIYEQPGDGTKGILTVQNVASNNAGIGGGNGGDGGNITISGGTVNATGGQDGAGIGGGNGSVNGVKVGGNGGRITISGGTVNATGGSNSAGIGGGYYGTGGEIIISGGETTATGSGNAAGIGGGNGGSGIGGSGSGGKITISGGTVKATGNANGAGIGNGLRGTGGTFSTGTSGNAVIFASSISDTSGKGAGAQNPWSGVIFEGSDGKVYGSTVTPTEDFTIPSGKTLVIPEEKTLRVSGVTATNQGTIYVDGTLEATVSGNGAVYYPLTLTNCTASGDVVTYPEGGTLYGKADGEIILTENSQSGRTFYDFVSPDSDITIANNRFTMPAAALTIEARYAAATVTVGGSTTNYLTLQDAFNAANGKTATITLLENTTDTKPLTITGGNITFEGGQYSFQNGINVNGGTLHFKSGTLNPSSKGITVSGSSILDFQGGTIEQSGNIWSIIIVNGTVNISDGTIGLVAAEGGNLNISNGNVNCLRVTGAQTALSGGSFGQINTTGNVSALLDNGYAYYYYKGWVDATNGEGSTKQELWAQEGTIQILPVPVRITTQPEDTSFTCGDTNQSLSVEAEGAKDKTVSYQWYQNGREMEGKTGSTLSLDGLNAGSYTYYCRLTCDSYVLNSNTVTVTVNKAVVEIPTITSKVYDGSVQTAEVPASERYTVKLNAGGTNAGSYDVVLELTDSTNYKWSDSENAEKTILFHITRATTNSWTTTPAIESWTYGGTASTPVGAAKFGTVTVEYKASDAESYSQTVPTNAGSYKARFTVAETDNYEGIQETLVDFTISPKPITATVTVEEKPYDGSTTATVSAAVTAADLISGDSISITGLTGTFADANAGTDKTVTVNKDNVSITGTGVSNYTVNIPTQAKGTITRADNSWTTDPAITGWTYGDTANAPTYEAKFGTVTVEYSADGTTYSETVPTNAGDYTARFTVAATNNYAGMGPVEKDFTISPKNITVTITPNGGTYGNVTAATAKINETLVGNDQVDVTLTYTGTANDGTTYSDTKAPSKAGTYTVNATISDSNYKLTGNTTEQFVVAKATVTTPTVASKAYNGEKQTADVTLDENSLYTLVVNNGGVEVKTEGYPVEFTLKDENNYQWDDQGGKTTFRITKATDNSWTAGPAITGWTYGEAAKAPTCQAKFGTVKVEYSADGTTYSETVPTNAGSYKARFTVADNDDCNSLSAEKDFTISPKPITVTITPGGGTYGGIINAATATANDLVGDDQVDVTLTYSGTANDGTTYSDTKAPSKAGSYTVNATISNSNYKLTGNTTEQFVVEKATVTTPTVDSKPYSGSVQTADVSNTDLYTVAVNNGGVEVKTEGYPVEFALKDSSNYQWDSANGKTTFQITQADNEWTKQPAITGWTYGDTASTPSAAAKFGTVTVEYKASDAEDDSYSETVPTNAGNYTARFTVAATHNYKGLSEVKPFSIEKRPLTLTWDETTTFTYDGDAHQPTAQAGNVVNGERITLVVSGEQKTVGDAYTATVTGFTAEDNSTKESNYCLPEQNLTTSFSITPKNLTVNSATVTARAYNGSNVVDISAINLDGVVTGEVVSVSTTGVTGTLDGSNAGTYTQVTLNGTLTLEGKGAGNYTLTQPTKAVSCDVTISPKELTIVGITAESKIYNGNKSANISTSFEGLVDSDVLYVVIIAKGDFGDANVGNGKTVTTTGFTLEGSASGNYKLPDNQPMLTTTANITPKELTVENVRVADKQYDGKNTAALTGTPTLVGVIGTDDVTLVNGTPTFKTVDVQEGIEIKFTTGFSLAGTAKGNYTLTQPTGITANIFNHYTAEADVDFTTNSASANSQGWMNQALEIEAKDGFTLSLTNTAEEENWGSKLTVDQNGTGTLTFYVRNATVAISQPVTISYKIDMEMPTGTISYDGANMTENSPVAVYKNQDVAVTIKDSDDRSGVASVGYLVSSEKLEENALKASAAWTEGRSFTIKAEDGATKYVYAKLVDKAGNETYLRANYIIFDTTAPSVTGVDNGATYRTTQTVTVADTNPASLTLNGTAATSPITLEGNKDATYTIVATDKAGNTTTVTVTMKTLDSLTEDVEKVDNTTVTKGDKANLEKAKKDLEDQLASATEAEKQEISDLLKPIDEALAALAKVEAVEQQIQALPESIQIDDEDPTDENAIKAARSAYEKLTDHEKTLADIEKLTKLESDMVAYKIISGGGSVWNMGSGEDLRFTANGPVRKLKQVELDGEKLEEANYQVEKGSTIVTLDAAFMQSLEEGSHTLRVVYTDGQTEESTFEVKRSESYLDLTEEPAFQGRTEVFVDGVSYPIEVNGDSYVNLPESGDLLTLYTYRTGAGDYGDYPTGMEVYRINRSADGTTVTHIPALSNLLQYSGCSIRVTGNRGIRMITSLDQDKKTALTTSGLAGFTLEEYGTVVTWASDLGEGDLNLNSGKHNFAYKRGVADPVFGTSGNLTQYTNVLVGFSLEECSKDIVMRPYIVLRAADGNQYTLYGGCVTRSISYIAWQNRDTYKPWTSAYDYVRELMGLYNAA